MFLFTYRLIISNRKVRTSERKSSEPPHLNSIKREKTNCVNNTKTLLYWSKTEKVLGVQSPPTPTKKIERRVGGLRGLLWVALALQLQNSLMSTRRIRKVKSEEAMPYPGNCRKINSFTGQRTGCSCWERVSPVNQL